MVSPSVLTQNLQELLNLAHQLDSTLAGSNKREKEKAIDTVFVRCKAGHITFEQKETRPWFKRLFQRSLYDVSRNYTKISGLFAVLEKASADELNIAFCCIKDNGPEQNLDEVFSTLLSFRDRLNKILFHVAATKGKDLGGLAIRWRPKATPLKIEPIEAQASVDAKTKAPAPKGWMASMWHAMTWGGSKATELSVAAAKKLIIPEHVSEDKLDAQRGRLNEKTKSHIATETAKVIGSYATGFLEHQVLHAKSIDPTLREPWTKNLLTTQNHTTEYSMLGNIACNVLNTRRAFIAESIEVNILKGMNNALTAFKTYQDQNPYFLVEILQETFDEVSKRMQSSDKTQPQVSDEALFAEYKKEFHTKAGAMLLKLAFPNGSKDLEVAISGGGWLKGLLWNLVTRSVVPVLVDMVFEELTSSTTRDTILLEAFSMAREVLEQSAKTTNTQPIELRPYKQEKEFSESFATFTFQFLKEISPKLVQDLSRFTDVQEKLKIAGPIVIQSIATIDWIQIFNTGMTKAIETLNPGGRWEGKEYSLQYIQAPFSFPSTLADKQRIEHEKKLAAFKQKVELDKLQKVIGRNLENLIDLITNAIVPAVTPKSPEELLKLSTLGTWNYMGKMAINTLIRRTVKTFVQLGAEVRRWRPKINQITSQTLRKSQSVKKESLFNPLFRTLSNFFKK